MAQQLTRDMRCVACWIDHGNCACRVARRVGPQRPHARRAEPGRGGTRSGPPLIIVKKVVTGNAAVEVSPRYGSSGQSNLAQMVRLEWSPSMPQSLARARRMSKPWCPAGSLMAGVQGPPSSWTSIRM
jgi:hypothetical protein